MVPSHEFLCCAILKYHWDDTEKITCLSGVPSILKNQGALEEEVVDSLKVELDEHKIIGR